MTTWTGAPLNGASISGDGLTLRPWQTTDADIVYRAMQDPAMSEFLPLPRPYLPSDAEAYIARAVSGEARTGAGDPSTAEISRAVIDDVAGRLVGSIKLRLPGATGFAEIGYAIYPHGQGHGFAARASRLLTDWAFANGLRRIEILASVRNLASAKTALNAGYRFEGIRREALSVRVPARSEDRGTAGAPPVVEDGALFARTLRDSGAPTARVLPALPSGLTDDVIQLRTQTLDDLDALLEEQNDPVSVGWNFTGTTTSRAELQRRVARAGLEWLVGSAPPLTIVDCASGRAAGSMTLRLDAPPGVANVGYGVHPSFRGNGYTTRALRLLASWAFTSGGFTRLELGAKTANIASQKSALNAGFIPDGIWAARLRNADGTFSDEARFALVNPDQLNPDQPPRRISP